MSARNFYPEKPVIPYKKTSVPMPDVVAYIQSRDILTEVKRISYIVFRNESANGKSGVNNNYAGIQADNARWGKEFDDRIVATCERVDSGGDLRRFVCFSSWKDSVDMTINRMQGRGIYVGGHARRYAKMHIENKEDLARAYYKEWVKGRSDAEPSKTARKNFISMYAQAERLFPEVTDSRK